MKMNNTEFLLRLNALLRKRGQNGFVKKGDVKDLVKAFAFDLRDNPKWRTRTIELLDDIEALTI